MRRVGIGRFWHETNTYSAHRTRIDDFAAFELLEGPAIIDKHAGTGTVLGGMLAGTGFEPVPLVSAGAWPSGRITGDTLSVLLARLEVALSRVGKLDGLLLDVHGAMVAEGEDDVEQAVVRLIRRLVGDVPLVVVCDLHGNPSDGMTSRCDAVVVYDTYPHVDMRERGEDAARIMAELLDGARYRTLVRKSPILICPLAQATDEEPMRGMEARARQLEREDGIRRVALCPGFPYSDVARAGFSVVVTYRKDAELRARTAAHELAAAAMDHDWTVRRPDAAAAVAEAMRSPERPVVLADVADNIGGGAPGDGTTLLAELLAQNVAGGVVAIADTDVARDAARVGEGAVLDTAVGGKADRLHGDPVRVRGTVMRVIDGRYRSEGSWMAGQEFSMGTTAVLQVDGVTLVVMECPIPPFHREQLTSLGIEPADASIIVAKGAVAWRAAFGDVARRVIEVDTPGICPVDPYVLPRALAPVGI
ncbi:MAG: M81 family metallopeptidase [Acidimicrobiales bacterium]